jgi:hypothetical protein
MTRKYRQSGYQESDPRDERERQHPPRDELSMEEKIQRRSLRKATNREANEVVRCHSCGRNLTDLSTLDSASTCPFCTAALHCCRGCLHFDSSARWQCRAPISVAVADKGKANACPRFSPRLVLDVTGRRGAPGAQKRPSNDPRSQFENLFRR